MNKAYPAFPPIFEIPDAALPARCFHCHATIDERQRVDGSHEGRDISFCCSGCHAAYLLIRGAGLDAFYRRRQATSAASTGHRLVATAYSDAYLERFVVRKGDSASISILIDRIRCAACVWLIEKMLGRIEGVTDVRIEYLSHIARVEFDPGKIAAGEIFDTVAALGYGPRPYTVSAARAVAREERRDLLVRFGTAAFLTMQLMACSIALYAGYFHGMEPGMKRNLQLFSLVLTTPVIFYSGWPFLRGAFRSLRNMAPNMDLLVSIGALSAYIYSLAAFAGGGEVYFESAAMIVTVLLAGRLLERGARDRAVAGTERLLALAPERAMRMKGEASEEVDVASLEVGDMVLVRPGENFPVDGEVVAGITEVDESPVTGESLPAIRREGDGVLAGTLNLSTPVTVEVRKVAAESFIARTARLVEEARTRTPAVQALADRCAALLVPVVLAMALLSLLISAYRGIALVDALMTAVSVVLIACPCALGLAIPAAVVAGSGSAARAGVIFRGGDVLERMGMVTDVVFDKTGTVTEGRPRVERVTAFHPFTGEELLLLAASLEASTLHPFGRAVTEHARSLAGSIPSCTNVRSFPGMGVSGEVGERQVLAGNTRFLSENGIDFGNIPLQIASSRMYIGCDGKPAGMIDVRDGVRAGVAGLVGYFRQMGIGGRLLSGDRTGEAARIAAEIGVGRSSGDMLPEDKAAEIRQMQGEGKRVLMIGDGINDAPALAVADVGCAFSGGMDVAMETSDLVLMRGDLELVRFAHGVALRTMRVVRQNLVWAVVYNAVGIPLAMSGRLTPVFAAAAMTMSSLCVVANSLRLARLPNGGG
ncbi:MAG: cadmium-translocating P-type ATPase [Geobacter sp.]|nr:cadmium-translocating P-type ATPase [Geobacter sp.]